VSDNLEIVEVRDRSDIDQFIKMPWAVYGDDPNWVPPLIFERRQYLAPKTNPYYAHADVALFLARRNGQAVGRISAQVNHAHLERYGDDAGHFGFLESINDTAVFSALTDRAESWLRQKGMRRVLGPFSFSINDECGLLVAGFDRPPVILMGHAKPYYGGRLEALGYQKAKDLIAYDFDLSQDSLKPTTRAMLKRLDRDPSVVVRQMEKKNFDAEVQVILDVFNDAWSNNWGFVPFTAAEIAHMAKEMKPLLDPELVIIVEFDGRVVAFGVTLPNIFEAIADLDGRLLPFGWAKILWRLKAHKIKTARVPLMGVRKDMHGPIGPALAALVVDRIHNGLRNQGYDRVELSWILEDNDGMRALAEATTAEPYKTYRIYEKEL
jgi:hypothetical protein